LDIINRN